MIFAISTWIIGPVSDIFLRFHPFGKYVLTDEEKDVANICAGLLTIAVVGAVMLLSYDLNDVEWKNLGTYLLCAGIALTVVVSSIASRTLERSKRRLKTCGIIFAIGCSILIVSALVLPVFALRLFDWLIWAFVGYQFLCQLSGVVKPPNHEQITGLFASCSFILRSKREASGARDR
jgi:MFS family permease